MTTTNDSPEDRIEAAIKVAEQYADIDGAHHKQWTINEMLRALMGKDGFTQWLAKVNAEGAEEYGEWDLGIAP